MLGLFLGMRRLFICFIFLCLFTGCKTYLIDPQSFKKQLIQSSSLESIPQNMDFCLLDIPPDKRGIFLLNVMTKDGKPFLFQSGANTELRFTKMNGKRMVVYLHRATITDTTFVGLSSLLLYIKAKPVNWDEISKIEIQRGGKRFYNYKQ